MANKFTLKTLTNAAYTTSGNWEGGSAPTAGDDVFFRFDTTLALAGSDQSATELGDIEVMTSCVGNAGSENAYLQLDQATSAKTVYAGLGVWYLDLGTSGCSEVRVDQTGTSRSGGSALYLRNNTNAITLVTVNSGSVRLTGANITTLVVRAGATVVIEEGSTITTIFNDGGTIVDYGAAVTTWNQRLGTTTRYGTDAASVNMYGGVFYNDSTGTLTAVCYGGILDAARDNRAKSVTLTINGGTAIVGPNVTLTKTFNAATTLTA
jgi:hypothetical protein